MSISLRLCVDFTRIAQAEIVCQFYRDCVSISLESLKLRSCVDLPRLCVDFFRSSLEFGSNLKNLHQGGECRKRIKNKKNSIFKLYFRSLVNQVVDRHIQELIRLTNRSTELARGGEEQLSG